MRCAVVELSSGLVLNVASVMDGDGSVSPDGILLIPSDTADINDTWDGEAFISHKPPLVPRGES